MPKAKSVTIKMKLIVNYAVHVLSLWMESKESVLALK